MVAVGFTLQPEDRFLSLLGAVATADADYLEVAPETLWYLDDRGELRPNGYFARILEMGEREGLPFVAHGVGWSVGSAGVDPARDALWREGIEATHERFRFGWYTDHLGATVLGGEELLLPLPVPMDDTSVGLVRERLAALSALVGEVGVENSAFYYLLGDPLDEPAFLKRCLTGDPRHHLLLDLHNLFTMSVNFGVEARRYVDRLPLDRVIEIHVSGGSQSDPAWLPDGATLRLDSHDHAVPEEVFGLLEGIAPRCPNLRGVTLERMEGTVDEEDVGVIAAELARIREVVG